MNPTLPRLVLLASAVVLATPALGTTAKEWDALMRPSNNLVKELISLSESGRTTARGDALLIEFKTGRPRSPT